MKLMKENCREIGFMMTVLLLSTCLPVIFIRLVVSG